MATESVFLTSAWKHLVALTWEVDPGTLRDRLPAGVELDLFEGRALVSLVGFMFLDTRVLGFPLPLQQRFEEVNLRFYVRRKTAEGWRRAVVFVKELVPRAAIAWVARVLYGENYVAVPMNHRIETTNGGGASAREVSYQWRYEGRESQIRMSVLGDPHEIAPGSEAEFITEHYWGYTRRRDGSTLEYRVDHPRWRVWTAKDVELNCDIAELYGDRFVASLQARPFSAFLADGSAVTVFKGIPLDLQAVPPHNS